MPTRARARKPGLIGLTLGRASAVCRLAFTWATQPQTTIGRHERRERRGRAPWGVSRPVVVARYRRVKPPRWCGFTLRGTPDPAARLNISRMVSVGVP